MLYPECKCPTLSPSLQVKAVRRKRLALVCLAATGALLSPGAEAQCCTRNASAQPFRHRSRCKQCARCRQTHEGKPLPPLLNYRPVFGSHRGCRIIATRGSTFANCARPSFDPRMAFSDNRNRSGFFAFSRSSLRKGRTFANMKYSSPQNAGSKNSFSLTTPCKTNDVAIPQ